MRLFVWQRLTLVGVLIVLLLWYPYIAVSTNFADSEIWAFTLSSQLGSEVNASLWYKVPFYVVLWPLHLISNTNWDVYTNSRILFAAMALTSAFLFYKILVYMFKDYQIAFWGFLLFVSNSYFWSQGFRIRSDVLVLFLQLCALGLFLRRTPRDQEKALLGPALFVIHSLMLACTPKALIAVFLNSVFFLSSRHLTQLPSQLKRLKLWLLSPAAFVVLALLIKPDALSSSFEYLIGLLAFAPEIFSPFSKESWKYVFRLLIENPVHLSLIAFACFWSRKQRSAEMENQKPGYRLGLLASFTLFALLVFPMKLPFFVYSLFPFLLLWSAPVVTQLLAKRFSLGPLCSLALVLGCGWNVYNLHKSGGNGDQKKIVEQFSTYMNANPGLKFFDGVGFLPLDTTIFRFPAIEHTFNSAEILAAIEDPEVEMVFFSQRMHRFGKDLFPLLEDNFFIEVGPGVFHRSVVFYVEETSRTPIELLKMACEKSGNPSEVWIYEGPGFLRMRHLSAVRESYPCSDTNLKDSDIQKFSGPFVAFLKRRPPEWPFYKSFAQVFDFDPDY